MITKQRTVQGVMLISLLIGIALGAFLIITMLQIFAASRANYQLARNLTEMDNVLRYAAIVMNNVIGQAGYRVPNATTGVLPAYTSAFVPFGGSLYGPTGSAYNTSTYPNSDDPAGVVLSYFPGENVFISAVDANNQDKLWVKFYGDAAGKIRECNDLYGDATTAIKVRFYSRTAAVSDGTSGTAYYCERQNSGQTYNYTDTPTGSPLIPAELLDSAWVRYGEDITGNGFIDRWSLGSVVQNRNQVYAVRVAFLVHSREQVRPAAVTDTFTVFDQTVTRTSQYLYRLYIFTIMLPNAPNYKLSSLVGTP